MKFGSATAPLYPIAILALMCTQAFGKSELPEHMKVFEESSSYHYILPQAKSELTIEVQFNITKSSLEGSPKKIILKFAGQVISVDYANLEEIEMLEPPSVLISRTAGIELPIRIEFPFGSDYELDLGANSCIDDDRLLNTTDLYDGSCTIRWKKRLIIDLDIKSMTATATVPDDNKLGRPNLNPER